MKKKWPTVWGALRYSLTKGALFMRDAGYEVRASLVVVGPVGLAVIWRRKTTLTDGSGAREATE